MAGLLFSMFAAPATTWIVAAGGGGQFTDIQTAILASQPGDVLLVQPGTYAPFALDRGLTLIGYGACNVSGSITIAGVPATETAAVVHIEVPTLDVQSCPGAVIVQDTQQLTQISVSNSPDVRLARVLMPLQPVGSLTPLDGLAQSGSRVEVVDSRIFGGFGADCASPAVHGAVGASCANGRLHMSRTRLLGGGGSSCDAIGYFCGYGNTALELQPGAAAILCGRATDFVDGGPGGGNLLYLNDCSYDGLMGYAVYLGGGALLRHSGVSIHDSVSYYGPSCLVLTFAGVQQGGGAEVEPPLADPTLSVSGNPVAGGPQTFTLDAPPGSTALLYVGRRPVVVPDPNTEIEVLIASTRVVNLGQVPAGGSMTFVWNVPSVLAVGTKAFAQAEVSVAPGDLRRTNSIPIILR